ncbi:cache domain-containing protein [Halorhodospira neutriphila]|nr:cache domain-containing protein [Halorhodospira neutriphila]
MARSKLFLKAFSTIVVAVLVFTAASYLSFVPWVRDTVQQQEERTGQLVLDNIHELLRNAHHHLEAWRQSAMAARRRELRHIIQVAEGAIQEIERESEAQGLSEAATTERILEAVRKLTYGRNDYVFIADYEHRLISHPDPQLHGVDFSNVKGPRGNLIVPPMVEGAREHGEGFHTYWWNRLGEDEPAQKLTYYKHLPERDWVIGTGVYIDDVEEAVETRKAAITQRLRRHLHNTRIAETGYLYVFDADLNMIIHPNPNIEGTNFSEMENRVTGQPIGKDLIAAARSESGQLSYKWDRPNDPGHYVYDKIAWVRHLEGFDWYIASSVYLSELRDTADALTLRILSVAGVALLSALLGAYLFLRRLTVPISRLAETASRAGQGDLTAKTEIRRNDEIGVLAQTFNATIDRLRDQIEHMDSRVKERTAELSRSVQDLERRNRQSAAINRMGELLHSCRNEAEIFTVVVQTGRALFPEDAGRVYRVVEGGLRLVGEWGPKAPVEAMADPQACWALRRGQTHRDGPDCSETLCPHCCEPGMSSLCIPLLAEDGGTGILKLNPAAVGEDLEQTLSERESLGTTVAKQAALSVTNLRLQERLRQQSIQDPLTGLLNRRRLEEDLDRELARAERHGLQIGVIMLDIDCFKRLNDTYGHESGDAALRELGQLLGSALRGADTAYRYGGEEFTLLAPETDERGLRALAERIRAETEAHISSTLGLSAPVTVSLGIAVYPHHGQDATALVKAADEALYTAKSSGRNRIAVAGEVTAP